MPLTSLNRIVTVLLVGGVIVAWLTSRAPNLNVALSLGGSTALAGFSFVVAAIVCGVAIDSMSDILINKPVVKRAREKSLIARLFLQADLYVQRQKWKLAFLSSLSGSILKSVAIQSDAGDQAENLLPRAAAGIFMQHTSKEHFQWMSTSDAMYMLCSNLSMCALLVWALEITIDRNAILFAPILLIFIFIFISRAINRDLYSEIMIFRFATIYCLEHPNTPSQVTLSGKAGS